MPSGSRHDGLDTRRAQLVTLGQRFFCFPHICIRRGNKSPREVVFLGLSDHPQLRAPPMSQRNVQCPVLGAHSPSHLVSPACRHAHRNSPCHLSSAMRSTGGVRETRCYGRIQRTHSKCQNPDRLRQRLHNSWSHDTQPLICRSITLGDIE